MASCEKANTDGEKRITGSRRIDDSNILWVPILSVNPHIICGLCQGYLYEACTITECMHSFCKNCIVKHLERSLNCPMCAILIHPTDPFVHIRLDGLLQDIVYALLPEVEKKELEQERLFYKKHGKEFAHRVPPPSSPLSLSCSSSASSRAMHSFNSAFLQTKNKKSEKMLPTNTNRHQTHVPSLASRYYQHSSYIPPVSLCLQCFEPDRLTPELEKQYVRVTGGATIRNLSTFLKRKLHINDAHKVDLYCPCRSGFVYLSNSHTLKAVKDLYCYDKDIVQLKFDISEP